MTNRTLAIDKTISLDINGSQQRLRLCAARAGLPPLLIVQHGPGFPLLHEAAKFRRRLQLEEDYLVAYWDQRGCGNAPARDAEGVSLSQQVDDLQAVLNWMAAETHQRVLLFGISIGATISLLAAAHAAERVQAVVAISPDLQTRAGDAAVDAFLREKARAAGSRRLRRTLIELGPPPYVVPRTFQRRAILLTDFGTIESGRTFVASLAEMFVALIRTYGVVGTVKALRNMNIIQRRLLPEVASLDLLVPPLSLTVPVHYLFGARDALTAAFRDRDLTAVMGGSGTTVLHVPDAGHLVHFDRPDAVRSVTEHA
jgi:pimeloyl-ACP methyl ester carboxylesterase